MQRALLALLLGVAQGASIQGYARSGCAGGSQTTPAAPALSCTTTTVAGQSVAWIMECPPADGSILGRVTFYAGNSCSGSSIMTDSFTPDACAEFDNSAARGLKSVRYLCSPADAASPSAAPAGVAAPPGGAAPTGGAAASPSSPLLAPAPPAASSGAPPAGALAAATAAAAIAGGALLLAASRAPPPRLRA